MSTSQMLMSFDELRWILSSRGCPLMKTTRLMMDKSKQGGFYLEMRTLDIQDVVPPEN